MPKALLGTCGLLVAAPYFASVKAACSEQIGIDCGTPRPPLPALTDQQRTTLVASLRKAGVIPERG